MSAASPAGPDGIGEETRTRILHSALRLFAGLGYDATTTEMIADAAGVAPETVMEAGGKRGLYYASLDLTRDALREITHRTLEEVPRDREGLHRLFDRHLDFFFEHPESLFLWTHRALSDAADLTDIEERYATPIWEAVADAFGGSDLVNDDEYRLRMHVIDWTLRGFVVGGLRRADGTVAGLDDPRARELFRAYLHRLLDVLPDPPRPG